MEPTKSQNITVSCRRSASGALGANAGVKTGTASDVCDTTSSVNATLYDKLNFNFINDIAPVASIARLPFVVLLHPSVPARTVAEFIGYAKANPGRINMASAGTGNTTHVLGELFPLG